MSPPTVDTIAARNDLRAIAEVARRAVGTA